MHRQNPPRLGIKHVSARFRFAAECNRVFDYAATTDYDFQANQTAIVVDHYPIESVIGFYLKSYEDEGWVLQQGIKYLILGRKSAIELAERLGTWDQLGRVHYSGGFVPPGSSPTPRMLPFLTIWNRPVWNKWCTGISAGHN